MARKLDNLEIEDVSALTTDTAEGFIQSLEDLDTTEKDLKALKSAEKSGKNREKVIQHINSKIDSLQVAQDIGVAQEDVEEVEGLLEDIAEIKNAESTEDRLENIERDKLLELVGGTVKDIKDFVRDNDPAINVLELLLESEKKVKDRKTARKFISKELEKQRLSKDVENTRKDLETLKEDLEVVEGDTDSEDLIEDSEEGHLDEDVDEEIETEGETADKSGEEESEKESEESKSEDDSSDEESSATDEEELSDIEKKKEILKSIEADIDDSELENVSIEELKRIKEDKSEREEIISELEEQGFDREKLQKASTDDLKTVFEEATDGSDELEESEEDESEKSEDEIRKEAEEDLQMLMGAVRGSDEEEEETSDRLADLREKIAERFGSDEEQEEEEASLDMNDKDVKDVLNKYRKLESTEASIKTAHVMKGYLETELGIKRELTYKELAEELPKDTEDMNKLAEFFKTMHKDEYMQNVDTASDEVIELCERIVEKF